MSLRLISRLCFRASARPSVKLPVSWRGYGSIAQQTSVQLDNASGGLTVGTSSYHPTWLRHNCNCPDCWSTASGQKTFDLKEISTKNIVKMAKVKDGRLEVVWSSGHHGYINLDWLDEIEEAKEDHSTPSIATETPILNGSGLLENKEKLWQWLYNLNEYGVCILTDMGTSKRTAIDLVNTMYHVQPTLYGETFDVKTVENFSNIAYSNQRLNFHMDQQYYEGPPGLQLLHCLQFDECVNGGKNLMLDMFGIVEVLREKYPHYFDTLSRIPATFERLHYKRDNPVDLTVQHPHIQLDSQGKVVGLRWTPASEGTLDVPDEDVGPYFEAYECLHTLMANTDLMLSHRLKPGEFLTVNNRRFLHARSDIKLNGGTRILHGIYADIDHFKSTYKVLCKQLGKDVKVRRVFNSNST